MTKHVIVCVCVALAAALATILYKSSANRRRQPHSAHKYALILISSATRSHTRMPLSQYAEMLTSYHLPSRVDARLCGCLMLGPHDSAVCLHPNECDVMCIITRCAGIELFSKQHAVRVWLDDSNALVVRDTLRLDVGQFVPHATHACAIAYLFRYANASHEQLFPTLTYIRAPDWAT